MYANKHTEMIALVFALCLSNAHSVDDSSALRDLGKKEYLLMKARSTLSQHGACWHDALLSVKTSCENLNDHEHSVLALKLANCFLEDSGHITYDCHLATSETIRRECINRMSDRAFGVYNEFYTHTTNVCFFLNHEIWQAETENTIKQLHQVSSHMTKQLVESSKLQGVMLESQKEGLKIQNELLDHGKELGSVLKTSSETVNSMVTDFRQSTKDQKELLFEIFSYIRTFQSWVIGEVSWLQSILYYIVSCILCALFSSTRRTSDARAVLFTILSLNVTLERVLVQYHEKSLHQLEDNKILFLNTVWFIRKTTWSLCAITLLCKYYNYKDEQLENHKVLQRIEDRLNLIATDVPSYNTETRIRYSKRLAIKRLEAVSDK